MENINDIIVEIQAIRKRIAALQKIPLEVEEIKSLSRAVDNLILTTKATLEVTVEAFLEGKDETSIELFIDQNDFEFNGRQLAYDSDCWYSVTPVFWASSSTYC